MKSFIFLSVLAVALCTHIPGHAQSIGPSTIHAAGGTTTIGGITLEYAIGQVVAGDSYLSSSLIVTPGVLQPQLSPTEVPKVIPPAELQVFPNPVTHTLYLQPTFSGGGLLAYTLYDAVGRLVFDCYATLKTGKEQQSLEVVGIAIGQYLLQVVWTPQTGSSYSGAFKVQKLR